MQQLQELRTVTLDLTKFNQRRISALQQMFIELQTLAALQYHLEKIHNKNLCTLSIHNHLHSKSH